MAGIRDEVELDVSAALAAIDSIGASLTQQVQQFQVAMAASLDQLRAGPQIDTTGLAAGTGAAKDLGAGLEEATAAAGDTTGAVLGLSAAAGTLLDGIKPVAEALGVAFGAKELIAGITGASEAAAGLDVQIKQIPIIFGDASQSISDFTQNSVSNLALGQASATQYANQLGRVFTAQGIAQQQAATLTEELLKRAADVATATGLTTEQVLSKFSGGLVGMSRAVRDLGAAFSVQEVNAKAASLGLQEVNGKFDEGALIQARAAIILDKTSYAINQLANNQDSLLVKQRNLSAEWQNATTTLGQQLIPSMLNLVNAFEQALPTLEKFASSAVPLLAAAVQIAIPILNTFVNTLKPITEALKLAGDVIGLIPSPILKLGESLLGITGSSDKAAASTKKAADSSAGFGDAASGAAGGADQLGTSMSNLGAAADATDKAVKAIKTDLDAGFGKYLDAAGAIDTLQTSVYKLGEELGKGPAKGQPLLDYQATLQRDLQTTVKNIEANALAMADAGQITADAASVNAEMVKQLQALDKQFPGLDKQIQDYINLLVNIPKTEETLINIKFAESQVASNPGLAGVINTVDYMNAGKAAANALADGLKADIGKIGAAGEQAGATAAAAAAAKAKETVLTSAASGLDLGGFIVAGIITDPAQQHAQDLNNFFAGMIKGIGTTVADAVKIDPAEAATILTAVEKVAKDTQDLAEDRKVLGANSIEAAIAEQQLGIDQANVNKVVLAATDSTAAYTAALKKLSDGVNAVTTSYHALENAQKAQQSLADAQKAADTATSRLGLFDQTIASQRAQLAATADPEARKRLQDSIALLQLQRADQAKTTVTAQQAVTDAQIGVVDAQQKIVDSGAAAQASKGLWEDYFKTLAQSAGLTKTAIDSLVTSLETAGGATSGIRNGVLAGNPAGSPTNPLTASLLAVPASGGDTYVTVNEATSARATAQQVLNELHAASLAG